MMVPPIWYRLVCTSRRCWCCRSRDCSASCMRVQQDDSLVCGLARCARLRPGPCPQGVSKQDRARQTTQAMARHVVATMGNTMLSTRGEASRSCLRAHHIHREPRRIQATRRPRPALLATSTSTSSHKHKLAQAGSHVGTLPQWCRGRERPGNAI